MSPHRQKKRHAASASRERSPAHPRRFLLAVIAVALLGTALVLLSTHSYGIGLSPDSAQYVSAARSLADNQSLLGFDGTPLVSWPPLYPALLSLPVRVGIDPVVAARWLNALTLGAVLLVAGLLLARALKDPALVLVATAHLLVSYSLLGTAIVAWTEPVFTLILCLFVLFMARWVEGRDRTSFVLCCLLAAIAPLQRYIGLVLPLSGLVLIAALRRPARRRALHGALFLVASLLPVALLFARNLRLTSTLSGTRPGLFTAVWPTALGISQTLLRWILPAGFVQTIGPVAVVAPLLLLATIAWSLTTRGKDKPRDVVRVSGVALTVYFGCLLAVVSREGISQLDRLLAPTVPLALIVLFTGLARLAHRLGLRVGRQPARIGALVIASMLLVYPAIRLGSAVCNNARTGVGGFESEFWRQSEVVAWLKSNPLPDRIHSNEPAAVYLLTGRRACTVPSRNDPNAQTESRIRPGDYYVWFKCVNKPALLAPVELSRFYGMDILAELPDGGVARFR